VLYYLWSNLYTWKRGSLDLGLHVNRKVSAFIRPRDMLPVLDAAKK